VDEALAPIGLQHSRCPVDGGVNVRTIHTLGLQALVQPPLMASSVYRAPRGQARCGMSRQAGHVIRRSSARLLGPQGVREAGIRPPAAPGEVACGERAAPAGKADRRERFITRRATSTIASAPSVAPAQITPRTRERGKGADAVDGGVEGGHVPDGAGERGDDRVAPILGDVPEELDRQVDVPGFTQATSRATGRSRSITAASSARRASSSRIATKERTCLSRRVQQHQQNLNPWRRSASAYAHEAPREGRQSPPSGRRAAPCRWRESSGRGCRAVAEPLPREPEASRRGCGRGRRR